ncbi:hypothetical protein ACWEQ0_03070 [Nocardia thailandica]
MFDPLAEIDRALAHQAGWSWFDDYLLYTCGVAQRLTSPGPVELPGKPTRIRLAAGEKCLAEGPVHWAVWRAPEPPRPSRRPGGITIGSSSGNTVTVTLGGGSAHRRRGPVGGQWVRERPGTATITDQRLHFTNPDRSFSLPWSALETIDLTAPDRVTLSFPDDAGERRQLQAQTPWAVLVFVVAALLQFPAHPLLESGRWLPAGFEEKCHLAGKACPRVR